MILAFAVYMCASYVNWGCYYIKAEIPSTLLIPDHYDTFDDDRNNSSSLNVTTTDVDTDESIISENKLSFQNLGLYAYPDPFGDQMCVGYEELLGRDDKEEIDKLFFHPTIQTARAFSLMASGLLGVCFLMLCGMSCQSVAPAAIKFLACLCFVGGSMELFTFLVYASTLCEEYRCQFGAGAGMAIAGHVLATVNAIIIYKLPRVAAASDEERDGVVSTLLVPGTTDVTETTLPDGSKRIIKVTVNYDGSQTVEETTIRQEQPIAQRPIPVHGA